MCTIGVVLTTSLWYIGLSDVSGSHSWCFGSSMGWGLGFTVVGEECGTVQEYDYTGFFDCPPALTYGPGHPLFFFGGGGWGRFLVVRFQIQDFV